MIECWPSTFSYPRYEIANRSYYKLIFYALLASVSNLSQKSFATVSLATQ